MNIFKHYLLLAGIGTCTFIGLFLTLNGHQQTVITLENGEKVICHVENKTNTKTAIPEKLIPSFHVNKSKAKNKFKCTKMYEKRIMEQRKKVLQATCDKYNLAGKRRKHIYELMFVDEERKILYCAVPKVTCSNWKSLVLQSSTKFKKDPQKLHLLIHHHPEYAQYGIKVTHYNESYKDYYKFMFVRHPLERVYSAYKDKFTINNPIRQYFRERFGQEIIKRYRKNPTIEELETGFKVEFPEFVKYLIDNGNKSHKYENHWALFDNLCWPCDIDYDFIGYYENVAQESQCVIPKLTSDKLEFPKPGDVGPSSLRTNEPNKHNAIEEAYRSVPESDKEKLKEIYKIDCEMFGYDCSLLHG